MERFKVTGQKLRDFYQENIPLGQVFRDIEKDLVATNQVVCQYIINGMEITEAEEAKFSSVSLAEIETLEYLTENSVEITSIVLKGWISALPELMEKTENLAKRMRAQGFSGLLKPIHDLVQNCQFLIDSTISIRANMGDNFQALSEKDWKTVEEQSKKTVLEALRALENKDFVLLADVLEYDLNNVLQNWLENLRVLESSLNGGHAESILQSEQSRSNSLGRRRLAN